MRLDDRFAVIVVALVLCAAGTTASARDRALVVGVNEYPNIVSDHKPGGKNLRGAVADAQTFVRLLVDILKFDPADVKLLTDAAASQRAILDGLETWLIDGSRPGDRVVFYFSGHGATAYVTDDDGTRRPTSTIVPADSAGDLDRDGATISGMIKGKTIGEYLARMKDRRIMVVADSCHSGSVTRGLETGSADTIRVRTITPRVPVGLSEAEFTPQIQSEVKSSNRLLEAELREAGPDGMVVWHAATIGQVTFDLPDRLGGIFTQSFADGLRDRKAASVSGDKVTAGALINYVRSQAEAFCRKIGDACRAGLTPALDAPPAYRNLVLNPYRPPSALSPPDTGAELATEATSFLSHENDFPLEAEIVPGTHIKLHSRVKFRIVAGEAGTLVVLDTGPDGKLRQIFPNRYSEQTNIRGAVRAGSRITIPDARYGFTFEATDPGAGTLLVLVAEQGLDLSGVLGRNLDFAPLGDPRGLIVELTDRVQAPMITPDLTVPNRGYRWAFMAVPYVVEP